MVKWRGLVEEADHPRAVRRIARRHCALTQLLDVGEERLALRLEIDLSCTVIDSRLSTLYERRISRPKTTPIATAATIAVRGCSWT